MSALLNVNRLSKQYGNHAAVDSISFKLEKHTATALIGPNGAGKTTTLSMLAGLVKQTSGSIEVADMDVKDIRTCIGFLPQYPKFFSWMSALEFTEMAAKLSGMDAKIARMESEKTLTFVGLEEAKNKKIATYSGGMKQRLGLAQAIVHKPKLLLLDEPVSALDPVGRRQVMNLLKELQEQTTILYSTHILNDAEEMTDQLIFMQKGKLTEQGHLNDVKKRYEDPKIIIEFEQADELRRFEETVSWHIETKGTVGIIDVIEDKVSMDDVLALLNGGNYKIRKVERQTAGLEDIFLKVVQGG